MNTKRLALMACLALVAGVLFSIQPASGVITCSSPGNNPYNCAKQCDDMKKCRKCCATFNKSNTTKYRLCMQRCNEVFGMEPADPPEPLPPTPQESGAFGNELL